MSIFHILVNDDVEVVEADFWEVLENGNLALLMADESSDPYVLYVAEFNAHCWCWVKKVDVCEAEPMECQSNLGLGAAAGYATNSAPCTPSCPPMPHFPPPCPCCHRAY